MKTLKNFKNCSICTRQERQFRESEASIQDKKSFEDSEGKTLERQFKEFIEKKNKT